MTDDRHNRLVLRYATVTAWTMCPLTVVVGAALLLLPDVPVTTGLSFMLSGLLSLVVILLVIRSGRRGVTPR